MNSTLFVQYYISYVRNFLIHNYFTTILVFIILNSNITSFAQRTNSKENNSNFLPPKEILAGKPTVKKISATPVKINLQYRLNKNHEILLDGHSGGFSNFTNYGTENGLPISSIRSGCVDHSGNLWFGTYGGGACRFDGRSFTIFNTQNGLANNVVLCIAEDSKHNIWLGTDGGGVSCYNGSSISTYTTTNGLASNLVYSIIEDKNGNIWFGTYGGGISKFNGKTFVNFNTKQKLASDNVLSILEDKNGNIWFGTEEGGVSIYDGNNFRTLTTVNGLSNNTVWCIVEDKEGNIWLGTDGGGVSCYHGKEFTTYSVKEGLGSNIVRSIAEDNLGNLWFGTTGGGVSCFNGKTFTTYTESLGLTNDLVRIVLKDKFGVLWFGTYGGGLSRFNGTSVSNFSTKQGLASNIVYSVFETKTGDLWFGTGGGGVSFFDKKSFITISKLNGLTSNSILSTYEDKDENLWIGTFGEGVIKYNGKSFICYNQEQGLPNNVVRCILQDRTGKFWFGTYGGGVSCFDGKSFINYSLEQGLPNNDIYSILEDINGNIWFGTHGGGVSCYDGKKFTNYNTNQGLANNQVLSIFEDKNANLWFGTAGSGVTCYDGKKFTTYTIENGLSDNYITQIKQDKVGRIFLGTNSGISVIAGWTGKQPIIENYNANSGWPIKDINTGQNAMLIDNNGIIWAGTGDKNTALVRFDYSELQKTTSLPTIQILGIKINEEIINWYQLLYNLEKRNKRQNLSINDSLEAVQQELIAFGKRLTDIDRTSLLNKFSDLQFDSITPFYPLPINLVLPFKHNHITFDYLAIDPSNSRYINYKHFLEGNDDLWSPMSKQTNAVYGNLKEGSYTFHLKAQNKNGQWTEPILYKFKVLAPWYRTLWAYLFYFILIVCFFYLGIKIYTQHLLKEKINLENIVKERTKEIFQQKEIIQNKVLDLNKEIQTRIQTEKMLKKLTVTVEQSPVSIVITDLDGKIEYVNPTFCLSTGYSANEVIGNNSRMLKGNTPVEVYQGLWNTILKGETWIGEFENRKKNGEYHFEEVVIAPIKSENNKIINFVALKNDITERKRNENALRESESKLKISNETKDKLFSIIAHDLRNPFSAILGFSGLLLKSTENNSKERIVKMIENVHESAQKAFNLLETLLAWAQSQTKQITFSPENIELSSIINNTIHELEDIALIKNIQTVYRNPLEIKVFSDPNLFKTVLRNLISNSIKYSYIDGLIIISSKIKLNYIQISVRDNGIGIHDEIKNRLFVSNLNDSTFGTKNEKGTGLGLVICKEFVAKLRGNIWVESKLGEGSEFSFTVPFNNSSL